MPRNYSMEKRIAAVEETRQRIVQATMELHDEKGILATSMQDIAARAGVALGTVYRHFPSLEELVPACGALISQLNPPPTESAFASLEQPEQRYAALVTALFAYYERGQRQIEVGLSEASSVPALARFMDEALRHISQLVERAIGPSADPDALRLARALSSFRAWQSMNGAGFNSEEAADRVIEIVASRLNGNVVERSA